MHMLWFYWFLKTKIKNEGNNIDGICVDRNILANASRGLTSS